MLKKLLTEVNFSLDSCFFKQTDGCTKGGLLSVIVSDIYMIKIEENLVKHTKSKFYRRFVDDI